MHKLSNGFKWLLVLGVIALFAVAVLLVQLIRQAVPDIVLVVVALGGLLTFRAWYRRKHFRS